MWSIIDLRIFAALILQNGLKLSGAGSISRSDGERGHGNGLAIPGLSLKANRYSSAMPPASNTALLLTTRVCFMRIAKSFTDAASAIFFARGEWRNADA